jgi:hypothetical protein
LVWRYWSTDKEKVYANEIFGVAGRLVYDRRPFDKRFCSEV